MARKSASESETEVEVKEDLTEIETLQKRIAELEAKNKAAEQKVQALSKKESGWLVHVPNAQYDGSTLGLRFKNGVAWVPEGSEWAQFKYPKLNEGQMLKLTEKEKEDLKLREEKPTAEFLVEQLANHFHYKVKFYTSEEREEVEKIYSERAKERMALDDAQKSADAMMKLTTPRFMGQ